MGPLNKNTNFKKIAKEVIDLEIKALQKLNIPKEMIEIIETIYQKPRFFIKTDTNKSSTRFQQSGIRQGCPLSPYLFSLVMTAMFSDTNFINSKDHYFLFVIRIYRPS